jgi:hypothetical protein
MPDGFAPGELVGKLIDTGGATSCHAGHLIDIAKSRSGSLTGSSIGDTGLRRRTIARLSAIAAVFSALIVCHAAMAQVDDSVMPTPTIGATSPLGMTIGSTSSPTGIPLGSTEISSAGVSPAPTGLAGTISIPATSNGTACSTVATSPSETYGSGAMYDGGGTTPGASAPATAVDPGTLPIPGIPTPSNAGTSTSPAMSTSSGMLDTSGTSGMCGSGSSSIASSSAPTATSPTTAGGAARTGIPFGSYEIGNLGVSSTPAVPLPSALPGAGSVGLGSLMPTMPTPSPTMGSATISPTTTTNPACAATATTTGTTGTNGIRPMSAAEQMLSIFFYVSDHYEEESHG